MIIRKSIWKFSLVGWYNISRD